MNLKIPLNEDGNLVTRLKQSKQAIQTTMRSASPKVTSIISKLGNYLPSWLFKALVLPSPGQTPGILFSNLPGPSKPAYIMGYRVLDLAFWITAVGTPWLTIGVISYNGHLKIQCMGAAHVFKIEEILDSLCTRLESELLHMIEVTES